MILLYILYLIQRLSDVGDDILRILDPYGKTDQISRNSRLQKLLMKFLLQMLCAAVLYAGGIRVDFVKNPLGIFMDGGPEYIHFPLVISLIITVIWIVGITNTVNLIDGLDGLAAGVAVIASGYISYAAVLSGHRRRITFD